MKNSYQSEGELVDEAKMEKGYISNLSKAQVRNERKFGKKGSTTPQGYFGQKPSQAAELSKKRTDEHKAKRGVKKGMSEGKATPKSGTGKYYKEGKPTAQQLKAREKYSKIKDLTNKGKHKEASKLYNEDLVNISNINIKPSVYKDEKGVIKGILGK